jgi:hypothetical protein
LLTCGRSTQSANCCRTDKVNCLRTAAAERLGVGNLKWLPACRVDSHQLRMLLQEVHDRRLRAGRIRCRMSVDLPRVPGGLPPVRHHPFSDRNVRLVHAVIRTAVNADGSLACWRSVAYTSPAVSNVRVTSTPKSHRIGAAGCVGWW